MSCLLKLVRWVVSLFCPQKVVLHKRASYATVDPKKRAKRQVTQTQKREVAASQQWCCGGCNILLSAYYEVDHQVALMNGGSNDSSNLVALCRECHAKKTAWERSQRR